MILFSVAVLVTAGTLFFTLFVRSQDIPDAPPVSPTLHLEERKARIYENLRDLQFEYRLGKLSDADYQNTKIVLQRELAATLAEIDAVGVAVPVSEPKATPKPKSPTGLVCPHCAAKFPKPLKFCGECGKAMV